MKKIILVLTIISLVVLSCGSVCMAQEMKEPAKAISYEFAQKDYRITRLSDYDTGYTLARCYAPSDYYVQNYFYYSLDGESDCSIACPYQIMTYAASPDRKINMVYRSAMSYVYPPDPDRYFVEGQRFGTSMNTFIGYPLQMMLYPRNAEDFADAIAATMVEEGVTFDKLYANYVTDESDPFLYSQSADLYARYNMENPLDLLFKVTCDDVLTSYGDFIYRVNDPDQPVCIRIVLSDSLVHLITNDYITGASDEMTTMLVPYIYTCVCTGDVVGDAMEVFDLFVANTRTTDEFVLMNEMESQMLQEIVNNGWSQYDEAAVWSTLGTDDGSFYEDRFSDYIFDQNEYTTSDGRSFKVSTYYDYVYEGADEEIYVSSSADQPAGSTRLYAR